MVHLRSAWRRFVKFDARVHSRLLDRYPFAVSRVDSILIALVDKIISSPVFGVLLTLVLVVLGIVGVHVLVLISVGAAWVISFFWIARSEPLRNLTVGTRLIALLVIGLILAFGGRGFGLWAIHEHDKEQQATSLPPSQPKPPEQQSSTKYRRQKSSQVASPPKNNYRASPQTPAATSQARVKFGLWDKAAPNGVFSVNQQSIIPVGDLFSVDFVMTNESSEPAEDLEIWVQVCDQCAFAEEPAGYDRPLGSTERVRHLRASRPLNAGVSAIQRIKVNCPPSLGGFTIFFKYSCAHCGTMNESGQTVTVLRAATPLK